MKVLLVLAALIAVALARPNSYGSSSQYEAPFRYGYVAKDDGYRRASYKSDYAYAPAHVEEQGSCPPWGTSSYSNGKIGGRSCFPGTNKYPKTGYVDYKPKQYSEPSYTKTEYAPATYDYVKPTTVKQVYTDHDEEHYVKPTHTAVYEAKPYYATTKTYYAPEARAVEQGSCAPWGVSSYEHGKIGGRSCFPGTNKYPKTNYADYKPKQYSEPSYTKTEYAPVTYDYVKPTLVKHTYIDDDDEDYVKPTYAAEVYDVKPYYAPTKAYYAPEARAVEQGSCAPWGVSSYEHGKVGGRSCFPGARSSYPKTEYVIPAKPSVEYNKPNWHYRRQ